MNKKISVLICTNNKELCDKTVELALHRAKKKDSVEVLIHEDTGGGISFAYNKLLAEATGELLLFMHHDIDMIHNWDEKLIERMEPFDIVGIAGASKFDVRQGRWWQVRADTGEFVNAHGVVYHEVDGNRWRTYFGETPATAQVLDGLFICVKKKCFSDGLKWDEDFKYDFYDISLCIRAQRLGLDIGVIYLPVTHKSPGLRALTEDYQKIMEEFVKKYA